MADNVNTAAYYLSMDLLQIGRKAYDFSRGIQTKKYNIEDKFIILIL